MRKIVHIDMDCFYAAIEERENPALRGKPVGVGGRTMRGVLTTANYEARKYGCRSAMPVFKALQLCPQLILVPTRFELYRGVSAQIRAIFGRFTERIEPLSLDEAYLDLSHLNTSGAALAREIRNQIREETGITASAGIAPNKMIAKIASDWNKPDGQHEVREDQVEAFMKDLPIGRIWGVGGKMTAKFQGMGIHSCGDLQQFDKLEMARRFGKWGLELWELCRGIDTREVQPHRIRKSISTENTFRENLSCLEDLRPPMHSMLDELASDLVRYEEREIRSLVVKLKFADFTRTTAEKAHGVLDHSIFEELLAEAWQRGENKPVRLLGVGIRFKDPQERLQMELL
ncbi:DNA polymerase IV [Luteolibacter luteus]|uniref:DNA polymerase IV n=1 Tax=Luteolibacter luteus TaxID=2728835 RepID=A0A858RGW8_9BACT|nr:DNA polymerase IV [Luteolibacter luteus]QJE96107.1 DNA polymerase IV [Luteolibacter luteus]